MIWHIFKKDWKLLWRFVLAVAAVQFASAGVRFTLDQHGENETLESLLNLFIFMTVFGAGFLIASLIHQDTIPGVRQDWLVRPVKRRDLILAKLLFFVLLVHGPSVAADALQALADGFPLGQALSAAIGRTVYLMLYLSLPMLAFATLTQNMTETVVGGVGVFLGVVALAAVFRNGRGPTTFSGIVWVGESLWFALALVGVVAVLLLQYFRRKTMLSRCLAAVIGLLCLATTSMPWKPAFALEQRMSPNPGSGSAIQVMFDPSKGKYARPSGMRQEGRGLRRPEDAGTTVYLPLQFAGLSSDTVLRADRAEIQVTGADGRTMFAGLGDDLVVRKDGPSNGQALTYHAMVIRQPVYNRLQDQPVRLEIDYSFTLSRLSSAYGMPALDGNQTMPGLGWCKTEMNASETAIILRCVAAGRVPTCLAGFLEHIPSGRRNPAQFACAPDYAPYFRQIVPDAMSRGGAGLRFRDPSGLAKFPVDGPQLPESRFVIRAYEPQDHFTRHLVIPRITLEDWEPQ